MELRRIIISEVDEHQVIVLKEVDGERSFPIVIGIFEATSIDRRVRGLAPRAGFKYKDKGSMATIGRARAVVESGRLRFSGFLAWLAWLFIHILYLARFENRALVLFQWFFNYITRNRAARLITGMPVENHPTVRG